MQAQQNGFSMTYEQQVNDELQNFPEHEAYPTAAGRQSFDQIEEPVVLQPKKLSMRAKIYVVLASLLSVGGAMGVLIGVLFSSGGNGEVGQVDTGVLVPIHNGAISSSTTTVAIISTTTPSASKSMSTSTLRTTRPPACQLDCKQDSDNISDSECPDGGAWGK